MIAQGHCVRRLSGVLHDRHHRCGRRSVAPHRAVVTRRNGVSHQYVPVPMRVGNYREHHFQDDRRPALCPRGAHDYLFVRHHAGPGRYDDRHHRAGHRNDHHPPGHRLLGAADHHGHRHHDHRHHVHRHHDRSSDERHRWSPADAAHVPHDHHEGRRFPPHDRPSRDHQHRCVRQHYHAQLTNHGLARHHREGRENCQRARGRHPDADRPHRHRRTGDHLRDDRRHGDGDPAQQTFIRA